MAYRNVDIVFCIDGSKSMAGGFDSLPTMIENFVGEMRSHFIELGIDVGQVRAKLIVFREYGVDEVPMEISNWLELPDGEDILADKLRSIVLSGRPDTPKNGLEALFYAMKSDFVESPNDRQIIVMVTGSDALDMEARVTSPNYPADMGNLPDLFDMWMGTSFDMWMGTSSNTDLKLGRYNKRLVMFAPTGSMYEDLVSVLDGAIFRPVAPGEGLADIDFDIVFKIMSAS